MNSLSITKTKKILFLLHIKAEAINSPLIKIQLPLKIVSRLKTQFLLYG
jgi:hypothetical protein